ncbi:MAG: S8 family serine peptidase [Acidobacteriota bacterium]
MRHRHAVSLLLFAIFVLSVASAAFAAPPPQISAAAAQQVAAIRGIKTSKTAVQNKIDSRLYLGLLHQKNDARLATLTDFRFVKAEADGRVPVQVLSKPGAGVKTALEAIVSRGGTVQSFSYRDGTLNARVHLADLDALAALSAVRKIRQKIPAVTHKVNTSEGDKTHGADEARGFFGATGAGVKVCALSDGVDSLASVQGTGDLPPVVDVLPGQAGSGDEGTAMLEILHDLAPGADLGFATANTDEATFAQNILDLATAGCNIIVDDVIYFDESPFEDGPVAQSVNTVTTAGVLYFSSAGNEGNANDDTSGTWEGDFLASAAADPGPLAGADLHDFGDGGNSISVTNSFFDPPLLIWAEHYDLANGSASTDFDLYDMDGGLTTILDASFDTQDGVGGDDFPIEFIGGGALTGERLLIDRFAAGTTSSVPMFNLIVFRGTLDDTLATNGATRGHSAAAAAFSVAATPAAASFDGISADGPFPGLFTAANESEDFTSDGPRRIILDTAGAELTPGNRTSTGGVVRQKPDITAADGVSTATPGFNPFYGTSAAAPHAAAIAALVKSAAPGITPAQVRTALIGSAIDIENAGVDRDTGAGIVMAHAAILIAGGTPQAYLALGTVTPTQTIGDGDSAIEPNEAFNLSIQLTNAGGAAATAISAVLTTSTPGITIVNGASAYPDLAIAASATNSTPFSFADTAAACGGAINFTLTVTLSGGTSPAVFSLSLKTGSPGASSIFSYAGPVVAIPDGADGSGTLPGAPVAATLAVAGSGNIYDVNFSIDGTACSATAGSTTVGLDHSWVNDLQLTLISPSSTSVLVINHTDGSGNNFCQTVLDDEGAGASIQSVATAAAPFTGNFTPNSSLAVLQGEIGNGNWQLQAQDFFQFDTGNIRAFSVVITPAVCNAPALLASVTGTKTVSGTLVEGGTVTYTVTLTNNGTGTQGDNPGHEFTDVLPAGLTLISAVATSGTAGTVGNTANWDGTLAASGGTVTITITATINAGTAGTTISNQGTISFDADGNGTNESTGSTDDPATIGLLDPTAFVVGQAITQVPTLSPMGLLLLAIAMLTAAWIVRRRRA